jgi:signal recognition particle GTPase
MNSDSTDSSSNECDKSIKSNKRAKMPSVKIKAKLLKKFQPHWLTLPVFQGWLQADKNNTHSCKVLKGGKSELIKHSKTEDHQNFVAMKIKYRQQQIDEMVQAANVEVVRQKAHEHQVKKFELLLSACFAEHNMAVQTVDHITEVLKKGIPDSKIVQDFHLKRTKCTQLIKEVLGKYESQTLVSDLQNVCTTKLFTKNCYNT